MKEKKNLETLYFLIILKERKIRKNNLCFELNNKITIIYIFVKISIYFLQKKREKEIKVKIKR